MSSALEAIETSTVAHAAAIDGIESAKAVPIVDLFTQESDGEVKLSYAALPELYPGVTVSINDDEIQLAPDGARPYAGAQSVIYEVPLYVGVFAATAGMSLGSARRAAWAATEAVIKALKTFSPTGFPDGTQGFGPLKPSSIEPVTIDETLHGMIVKFWARYQIH
jgi:hypothetical protein